MSDKISVYTVYVSDHYTDLNSPFVSVVNDARTFIVMASADKTAVVEFAENHILDDPTDKILFVSEITGVYQGGGFADTYWPELFKAMQLGDMIGIAGIWHNSPAIVVKSDGEPDVVYYTENGVNKKHEFEEYGGAGEKVFIF